MYAASSRKRTEDNKTYFVRKFAPTSDSTVKLHRTLSIRALFLRGTRNAELTVYSISYFSTAVLVKNSYLFRFCTLCFSFVTSELYTILLLVLYLFYYEFAISLFNFSLQLIISIFCQFACTYILLYFFFKRRRFSIRLYVFIYVRYLKSFDWVD